MDDFGYGKFVSIGYRILLGMSLERSFDPLWEKSHVAGISRVEVLV
jgi:hypothetical protein